MTNADITGDAEANTVRIGHLAGNAVPSIRFEGTGAVVDIGDNVFAGTLRLILEDNARITIGKNTTFRGANLLASSGCDITIGRDCMFSHSITVRTSDAHPLTDRETGKILNPPRSVSVGDHVWVGEGVRILCGSNIPHECTIGAGSLVKAAAFKEASTIAGIPARIVREGTRWYRNWEDAEAELKARLERPAV